MADDALTDSYDFLKRAIAEVVGLRFINPSEA
jgi:hypothetical protein